MRILEEANKRFDAFEHELKVGLANGVASDHAHYKFIVGQIDGLRQARKLLVEAVKFLDSDAADPDDAAPAVMVDQRDKHQRRIRGYGEH